MNSRTANLKPGNGTPLRQVRPRAPGRARAYHRPDPATLFVLLIMSMFTISTPTVEIAGLPRITLVSVLFTIYMFFQIRGRLNPDLLCFVLAYVVGFLPSTFFATLAGDIRISSLVQGAVGLITFLVVGTYFCNWLTFTPLNKIVRDFKTLTILLIGFSILETIFFQFFVDIRLAMYKSEGGYTDTSVLIARELAVYGGRPSGMFSEPSHFARYIGLMMAAYLAASRRSVSSLWAFGAFLLATRSVSYFFAIPTMVIELRRAATAIEDKPGRSKRLPAGLRLVGIGVVVALALAGLFYTQSDRINAALGARSNTSAAVTGDNSLNERIVIPAGYFFDGPKPLLFGLGPTPQDEMQEYTVFATRSAYHSRLNTEYKSAVSTAIFTLAGMGYIGLIIMFAVAFQLRGVFGVGMVAAYFIANTFSSGYNSSTSLVPSGLLLGIMSFQHLQQTTLAQTERRMRKRVD